VADIRTYFTIWERFGMGALWPGGVLSRIRTRYVVGASVGRYIRQCALLACDS